MDLCEIVLLDIFYRLNYKTVKLQRFERWVLLFFYPMTEVEDNFLNVVLLYLRRWLKSKGTNLYDRKHHNQKH
jgi:hypothetical protein